VLYYWCGLLRLRRWTLTALISSFSVAREQRRQRKSAARLRRSVHYSDVNGIVPLRPHFAF